MISATVIGNLGRDAELKTIAGGRAVCNFSVASAGRAGNEKVTTWVRCAMWGARGEKVAQYLTKGTRVGVSGTLTTREHDGKTYLELDVHELELLGDRPKAQDEEPRRSPGAGRRPPPRNGHDQDGSGGDDDLPF